MAVFAIPEEKMQEVQQRLFQKAVLASPPRGNVEAATTFHDAARVLWNGRWYSVPPTSFRHGVWLNTLRDERRRLQAHPPTRETRLQDEAVLEAMVDLFQHMVRRPWWMRLLRRNPFQGAAIEQIEDLASFFSRVRTTSPVVVRASVRAPAWVQQTWPTPFSSLRVGIHATWATMETPAVTDTSAEESSV